MKQKPTCKVSDDWTYKGMKVIFMENEYLRIGILADRGSDIFECISNRKISKLYFYFLK